MKQTLLLLLIAITLFSCSKETSIKNNAETYLTINGDTREIKNTGDPDLEIIRDVTSNTFGYPINSNYKVLSLSITDPNHSLIGGFGGYNYGYYFDLHFVVPNNFQAGTYTTTNNSTVNPSQSQSFCEFLALTEFVKEVNPNQTYNLTEKANTYVVEFDNLEYLGNGNTATISGKITIDK